MPLFKTIIIVCVLSQSFGLLHIFSSSEEEVPGVIKSLCHALRCGIIRDAFKYLVSYPLGHSKWVELGSHLNKCSNGWDEVRRILKGSTFVLVSCHRHTALNGKRIVKKTSLLFTKRGYRLNQPKTSCVLTVIKINRVKSVDHRSVIAGLLIGIVGTKRSL